MSYSIPSMEDIRLRIRAALDVARPGIDGKGLARELGIPPSQVTSLLKPSGRALRIDEISVVENYLGIKLFDEAPAPSIAEGVGVPVGPECVAWRQDRWITVVDADGEPVFLVKSTFPVEHLGAVLSIRNQSFHLGVGAGESSMKRALRKLIGAAEAEDE